VTNITFPARSGISVSGEYFIVDMISVEEIECNNLVMMRSYNSHDLSILKINSYPAFICAISQLVVRMLISDLSPFVYSTR
jgi:hypothetical protein